MGTPYKVTVQGREVFLCCPGCEAKIKGDPEKYLAKLPE
jgi:Cu(I)/Ag(I) efflux system membrane fusion protein